MNVIITGSAAAFLRGLRPPRRLSAELLQQATEKYLHAFIDRHCYLKLQGMGVSDRVAGDVVEALITEQPGEPGEAVVLAGEAVLDAVESGVPLSSRERVIQALVETMQSGSMTPLLRRRAGLALGDLGWQPDNLDVFVEVPSGKFLYGDEKEEREIPYRYWIGRYPVTYAQYACFVDAGGYNQPEFWSAEGWEWRKKEDRVVPVYWQNSKWNNPIFPVVGVTQYEAQAYCRWLDAKLRDDAGCLAFRGAGGEVLQADGAEYRLRLPTELEWECAARGIEGREYPWGDEFDAACANVRDIPGSVNGTNAVSTYPQGVSPVGAWDMSGNVWEWTVSGLVLRGGSWYYDRRYARCASRDRNYPHNFFHYDIGFRLVVSLVDSEF